MFLHLYLVLSPQILSWSCTLLPYRISNIISCFEKSNIHISGNSYLIGIDLSVTSYNLAWSYAWHLNYVILMVLNMCLPKSVFAHLTLVPHPHTNTHQSKICKSTNNAGSATSSVQTNSLCMNNKCSNSRKNPIWEVYSLLWKWTLTSHPLKQKFISAPSPPFLKATLDALYIVIAFTSTCGKSISSKSSTHIQDTQRYSNIFIRCWTLQMRWSWNALERPPRPM